MFMDGRKESLVFAFFWALQVGLLDGAAVDADELVKQPVASARKANRLAQESSPYLLLHAHNPVDWYPWGPEAFAKARGENKPIFLSIGYSSCFWCHVMERNVFENDDIAAYMNEHFVNIKVDREERPDVDEIYMLALQVYLQMIGSAEGGGWPLSLFLTPDGKPIAGGTYFPPEEMPGRPSFPSVMKQLVAVWETRQEDVERTAEIVAREVRRLSRPGLELKPVKLDEAAYLAAVQSVADSYDLEFGGFDFSEQAPNRPKFPSPANLGLLQAQIARGGEDAARLTKMLDHTLHAMAAGGIYDHLGGGFHRYSTDRKWLIPHFEKMLYDNAQLAEVYAVAYRRTLNPEFRTVAEETLDFVIRELTDPEGAFYSALDAETAGVEGEYYVWMPEEVQQVLSPSDYQLFARVYGLDQEQSFEHGYVLHRAVALSEVARESSVPLTELQTRLQQIRQSLLAVRQKREPLLRDDKILTSWNGLMIQSFAVAGKNFQRPDYIARAEAAATYLLTNLRDQEGRLLRTSRNGKSSLNAYLDDYAFLTSGLLALYDATQSEKWLNAARRLTDNQIAAFWDREGHGFFFTAHDHESLIARTKSAYDSALPSGNSVSIKNLLALHQLTGTETYLEQARQALEAFGPQYQSAQGGMTTYAQGLQMFLQIAGPIQTKPSTESLAVNSALPQDAAQDDERKAGQPVIGLSLTDTEAKKHPRLKAIGLFGLEHAVPGKSVPVAIHLRIAENWHINANPAQPDFAIPTELSLAVPEGWKLTGVKYPKGKPLNLPGFDVPLSVYEGDVVITGQLDVPANASETQTIQLKLRYQACDDQTCERPLILILDGTIDVSPAESRKINAPYFPKS